MQAVISIFCCQSKRVRYFVGVQIWSAAEAVVFVSHTSRRADQCRRARPGVYVSPFVAARIAEHQHDRRRTHRQRRQRRHCCVDGGPSQEPAVVVVAVRLAASSRRVRGRFRGQGQCSGATQYWRQVDTVASRVFSQRRALLIGLRRRPLKQNSTVFRVKKS